MNDLTWTCHVCEDERPDRLISVRKRDESASINCPPGTMVVNVRYCNDRPDCFTGAATALKTGTEKKRPCVGCTLELDGFSTTPAEHNCMPPTPEGCGS